MSGDLLALPNALIKGRSVIGGVSGPMKFDMSAAWRDATTMMAGNREVLLIVAGLFFFLPSVIMGLAMGDVQELAMADPENAAEAIATVYGSLWWLILLLSLASIVGYLALLALLRDHSRPTVGHAIRIGLAGLLPAIGTYLVLALALGIAGTALIALSAAAGGAAMALVLVILFVGFVYLCVKFSLAGPVIAIDKVYNPLTVLARSWQLTKGNSFRLFLFYLLIFIAYFVVAMVVGMVFGVLTLAIGAGASLTVNAVISGAISAVVSVVRVAVIAAAHRQLSGPSAEAVSETFE